MYRCAGSPGVVGSRAEEGCPCPSRPSDDRRGPAAPRRATRPAARDALDEEITDAESRILGLLPADLTLRQIGERLYLSVNTVKSHTRSLYRKLEAGSRAEAVARARELGLL